MTEAEWENLKKLAEASAANFGAAKDIWHPDYGWILLDGEVTTAGLDFALKNLKEE